MKQRKKFYRTVNDSLDGSGFGEENRRAMRDLSMYCYDEGYKAHKKDQRNGLIKFGAVGALGVLLWNKFGKKNIELSCKVLEETEEAESE